MSYCQTIDFLKNFWYNIYRKMIKEKIIYGS